MFFPTPTSETCIEARSKTYLLGCLDQERDDEDERPSERPPDIERAHVADRLGSDRVHDSGQYIHAPGNGRDLYPRQRAALAHLRERRDVECDAVGNAGDSALHFGPRARRAMTHLRFPDVPVNTIAME